MCMTSAHGTTNGSAYAIWWAMLCGTSTQTDRGCTRGPIFMRSLRAQPLSSALRLKNNTREQHECTNLMHSDLSHSWDHSVRVRAHTGNPCTRDLETTTALAVCCRITGASGLEYIFARKYPLPL